MSDVTEPARDPQTILAEAAALTARTSDLDAALAGLLQLAVDAADATPNCSSPGPRGWPPTPPNAS